MIVQLWLTPIGEVGSTRAERNRAGRDAAERLLRHALRISPEELTRNAHGKPALPAGGRCFSLSHHSGSYAVLAVADGEVGVDIEPVSDRKIIIPRRFLRQDELDWLGTDPDPERFAVLWTRLEAAIKADGRGFDMEHRDFSVVESGQPWHMHTFAHDGHVISCAAGVPFEVCVTVVSAEELK